MNDIKGFDEMTVAELRGFLTERGRAGDGDAMKWNTKTRKPELIELCKEANQRKHATPEPLPMTPEREAKRKTFVEAFKPLTLPDGTLVIDDLSASFQRFIDVMVKAMPALMMVKAARRAGKFKSNKRGKRHARFGR